MSSHCSRALEHLVDYLEDELEPEEREALEEHLAACPPCVRFLETYRATGTICKKALEHEMPTEMKQSLLAYLRSQTHTES